MSKNVMKNDNEILKLDLSDNLLNVEIPYVCIQGDTDIVASTKTLTDLVNKGDNSNLEYIVIKDTGHMPGKAMMDKLMEILKKNF